MDWLIIPSPYSRCNCFLPASRRQRGEGRYPRVTAEMNPQLRVCISRPFTATKATCSCPRIPAVTSRPLVLHGGQASTAQGWHSWGTATAPLGLFSCSPGAVEGVQVSRQNQAELQSCACHQDSPVPGDAPPNPANERSCLRLAINIISDQDIYFVCSDHPQSFFTL